MRPAAGPAPFSPTPGSPAPPPAPPLRRPPGTRARLGPAAPSTELPGPTVLPGPLHSRERRLLPAEFLDGGSGEPQSGRSQKDARGFGLNSGWVSGSLCRVRVLWTTALSGPLQRLHREGSGARAPRRSPAPRKARVGFEPACHFSLPGRGLRSAQPLRPWRPWRTTTQTFFRPLFSSKLGIHGDRAWQPDSPTA